MKFVLELNVERFSTNTMTKMKKDVAQNMLRQFSSKMISYKKHLFALKYVLYTPMLEGNKVHKND